MRSFTALFRPCDALGGRKNIKRVNNRVKLLYRMKQWFYDAAGFFVFEFYTIDVGLAWLGLPRRVALVWFSLFRIASSRHDALQHTLRLSTNTAIEPAIAWSLLWMKMNKNIPFHFPLEISFFLCAFFSIVCFHWNFCCLHAAHNKSEKHSWQTHTIQRLFIYATTRKK